MHHGPCTIAGWISKENTRETQGKSNGNPKEIYRNTMIYSKKHVGNPLEIDRKLMANPAFLFRFRLDAKCGPMRFFWNGLLKLTLVFNICLDAGRVAQKCVALKLFGSCWQGMHWIKFIYTSLVIVCPERTFACGALANLWIDVFSIFPSQKAINRTLPYI